MWLRKHYVISFALGIASAVIALYFAAALLGHAVDDEKAYAVIDGILVLLNAFASQFFFRESSLGDKERAESLGVKSWAERIREAVARSFLVWLGAGAGFATFNGWALWRIMEGWDESGHTDGEQTAVGVFLMECACIGVGFMGWVYRTWRSG